MAPSQVDQRRRHGEAVSSSEMWFQTETHSDRKFIPEGKMESVKIEIQDQRAAEATLTSLGWMSTRLQHIYEDSTITPAELLIGWCRLQ